MTERLISNIFIILILFILFCWDLPSKSIFKVLINYLQRPIKWLGLWHSWKMFAPMPLNNNYRIYVEIQFKNGEVQNWPMYHFDQLNKLDAYLNIRYRKLQEHLNAKNNNYLKTAFCEYVIENIEQSCNPSNPPIKVKIYRSSLPIKFMSSQKINFEALPKINCFTYNTPPGKV